MTEENRKEIECAVKLIEEGKYDEASASLSIYSNSPNAEISAMAFYLLGYINTCWQNNDRKENQAKRYLLHNLNSEYPHPNAYALYARLEEDKNIVERYIKQGLTKFHNHPELLYQLLINVQEKEPVITQILDSGSYDFKLLSKAVEVLIAQHNWERIKRFIFRIQSNNDLNDTKNAYLNLLNGYALIFGKRTDYLAAIELLENVASDDIDNQFGYAHYLGIIYANLKKGSIDETVKYFDKLPLNNSIFDLVEGPWHFIIVDFFEEYKEIFDALELEFEQDSQRRIKARALFSLYLYHPSELFGIYRYSENDINNLQTHFNMSYNKHIASALVNMYCHYEKFIEANLTFMIAINNSDDLEDYGVYYCDVVSTANVTILQDIVKQTYDFIEQNENFDDGLYVDVALDSLVDRLKEEKLYEDIVKIAELFSVDTLCKNENAFYFAYSYAEIHSPKGLQIYKKIVENDPENAAALNNLGVLFEENGDLEDAKNYFKKAFEASKKDLYEKNLKRIESKLEEKRKTLRNSKQKEYRALVKNVTVDFFDKIGYTSSLIAKFDSIQDKDVRELLLRDMQECVIAIATGQAKSATIMAGSIIEALLYTKIKEKGIVSYSIQRNTQSKNVKLENMALAELLFVAEQEKMVSNNSIHLSHYVRDYRNFIHPAKEIRSKDTVSQENIRVMWLTLKRMIDELL